MRFHIREHHQLKYWKLSLNDLKTLKKWEEYTFYKNQMFEKTSSKTELSPSASPRITLMSAKQRQFSSSVKSYKIACRALCSAQEILSENLVSSIEANLANFLACDLYRFPRLRLGCCNRSLLSLSN